MKLQKQVTNKDISKRIKELGVKQDSLFYYSKLDLKDWEIEQGVEEYSCDYFGGQEYKEEDISAFTVAELGEMLPEQILWKNWDSERDEYLVLSYSKEWSVFRGEPTGSKNWVVTLKSNKEDNVHHYIIADTEADARGKMLIYLLENNLITL